MDSRLHTSGSAATAPVEEQTIRVYMPKIQNRNYFECQIFKIWRFAILNQKKGKAFRPAQYAEIIA
jgi:hypothetical protein